MGPPGPTKIITQIFGVLFFYLGVHALLGRFIISKIRRSKLHYGISNKRVIIVSTLFGKKVRSIILQHLSDIAVSERPDGFGTISFGIDDRKSKWAPQRSIFWGPVERPVQDLPRLELVENPKEIDRIIRDVIS